MEQVTGSVTDIVYRNDANYYTVFEVQTEYGALTCTGSPASIRVGEILAMTGELPFCAISGLALSAGLARRWRAELSKSSAMIR